MSDTVTGGTLNAKTLEGSMELFKEIAMNSYQWYISRVKTGKTTHVYDVDTVIALIV